MICSSPRLGRRAAITAGAAAAVAGALIAASSPAVAAGTPGCQTKGLVVWLNTTANGAAGSNFYTLNFTNLSGRRCMLRGYPGVSAVNLSGRQLGKAASRNNARRIKTISIRNGGTAKTTVQIVEAANFPPSACGLTTAAGLRVFPPNQGASKTVPFPVPACSKRGPAVLSVQALR
jgi:uncharacterized protein (DUF1501 family)